METLIVKNLICVKLSKLRPLSDSSIRMTPDLCTENSRVHRLLSGMEEMRFVFFKINFISFKSLFEK